MFASQSYYDHDHVQFSCLVGSVCFLCNSKYSSNLQNYQSSSQASRFKIHFFCDTFSLDNEEEKEEVLRHSQFGDPFCPTCSQKVTQLQDWSSQLQLLQKGIEDIKADIRRVMAMSLPQSTRTGSYNLKLKMLKSCTVSDVPDENDIVYYEEVVSESIEEMEQISNDEDWTPEQSTQPLNSPPLVENQHQEKPISRKKGKKIKRKKSSEHKHHRRLTSTRRQGGLIPAHPSGQCHLCPSKLPSQFALSRHIKRSHSGVKYPCRYCGKVFNETSNRNGHERAVHLTTSRDFVCDLCGRAYKSKTDLRSHVRVKHEGMVQDSKIKKPTQCHECGGVYSSRCDLRIHTRRMHTQLELKPCPICERPFKTNVGIKIHLKSHISPWERKLKEGKTFFYKCEICPLDDQVGFNAKVSLHNHYKEFHPEHKLKPQIFRKEHSKPKIGPKRYFCTVCAHRPGFNTGNALNQHIYSGHKRLKPIGRSAFPCEICGKPFKNRSDARNHKATHIPNGFLCNLCNTVTLRLVLMREHYKESHPNEPIPQLETLHIRNTAKEFFCPLCPNSFGYTSKPLLFAHMRKSHKTQGESLEVEKIEPFKEKVEEIILKLKQNKDIKLEVEKLTECGQVKRNRSVKGDNFFYKCDLCEPEDEVSYNSKLGLQNHYREFHPKHGRPPIFTKDQTKPMKRPKQFFCEVCPHRPGFTESWSLRIHINSGHKRIRPLGRTPKCKICGKPTHSVSNAKNHETTHHPKGFICHICDELILRPADTRTHYAREHPNVKIPPLDNLSLRKDAKEYFCSICPGQRSYISQHTLDQHMRLNHKNIERKVNKYEYEYGSDLETRIQDDEEENEERNGQSETEVENQQNETQVKECVVSLGERVDSNWPSGKVIRVRKIESIETKPTLNYYATKMKQEKN